MSDLIERQKVIDEINRWKGYLGEDMILRIQTGLKRLTSTEPETAKRIVGCARNGMTMWYQCDMCHEPVDEKDTFCRGCGRRFEDG